MITYQMPYYKEPKGTSGEDFEEEVSETFFPDSLYEMLHKTSKPGNNQKRFVRSSLNPDFHFEIRENARMNFWVACKSIEIDHLSESINVFSESQLNRFRSFEHSFLFLCIRVQKEEYHYFLPLNHIKSGEMHFSFLKPYTLSFKDAIKPELVMKYLRSDTPSSKISSAGFIQGELSRYSHS